MKHITFIAAGLMGGGIEKAFSSLANHLVSKDFKISILLLFKTEHFFRLDGRIKVIEPGIDRSKINRMVYAVRIIPYVRKQLRVLKPDVLLSYGEWFNPFVILATRGLGIPLYVSDRMSPTLKLGGFQDHAKRILYRYSDGVIAQTQYASEMIHKRTGHTNIKVIPNPVNKIDIDDYNPQNQIVTVGRLSREKGHSILIKAFANTKNEDWSLHIVGDGLEKPKLESLTKESGISEKVIFHGHLKDFKNILSSSDIFVLPSLSEGFPNALIEAMSVPLACISSDCIAGPSDIIEHNINGILVPPGNVTALSEALDTLIENPDIRAGLSSNAYKIRNRLDFNKIANEVTQFVLAES